MSDSNATTSAESVPEPTSPKRRKIWRYILGVPAFLFVAIQFIPYGHNHTNPPPTASVTWDSKETENLVRAACYDCHSNETVWPWYSNVAPVSWLVQRDVDHGRMELNFSEGNLREVDEAAELIESNNMPPWFYRPMHSGAKLSAADKETLIKGFAATFDSATHHEEHED